MPIPFLLAAAAAAPSIYKGLKGLAQADQTVTTRDTTPAAFKESLALTRQAANTNRLPGEGVQENRIAQGTAAVNAGALRAGASSSDVLASLAASDAQQKQALAELGARGEAYHQQQQGVLRQQLGVQAAYQQHDLDNATREQAALRQAGQQNMFGALEGLSQVAAYGLGPGSGAPATGADAAGNGVGLGATSPLPADLQHGLYDNYPRTPGRRTRYDAFGNPIPAGLTGIAGY